MPRSTDYNAGFNFKIQVLPELKLRPNVRGEVTRSASKGASSDVGGLATTKAPFPAQAGGAAPDEGVKEGKLYYRAGESGGARNTGPAAADDDDDDNAKGGLIRKVKGPKPKGSKDDGKINAQRGEFVMKKTAVKQHGVTALTALNDGRAKIVMHKNPARKAATRR